MKMRQQAVPGIRTGKPEATLAKPRCDGARFDVDGRVSRSKTAPENDDWLTIFLLA